MTANRVVVRRSAEVHGRCAVCGHLLAGWIRVSGWDQPFCERHERKPSCSGCGLPVTAAHQSTRPVPLCADCRPVAVLEEDDVRRILPGIRADLAALGVTLRSRTKVNLVDGQQLTSPHPGQQGVVNGLTTLSGDAAVEVAVRKGLTLSQFGATVAHEAMHAFLFERGFRNLDRPSEEGLCEVLAYEWLRRRPGRLDRYEELRTTRNQDPVYGRGYRTAQAAVERLGVVETLRVLRRTGRIPAGP